MKKVILFLLSINMLLFLGACDNNDSKNDVNEYSTELNTKYTDDLKIDFSYAGKNFVSSGIGEVELVKCTDGDTANFTDGNKTITVRFSGIDTPESTAKFDPFGKAASNYTCDKLSNATSIVLETDSYAERTDGNGRYLAWVWYDGRLLNLELIEQAYSHATGASGTKYESVLYQAELEVQKTKRRIWGEVDPDYDYSLEGAQITIEELVTNASSYIGKKVVVRGIVTRTVSGSPYIQHNGYGIYLYKGYENTTKFVKGNEVQVSGLTLTYYPDKETGLLQVSGLSKRNIEVLSTGNEVEPLVTTINDLNTDKHGLLVKLQNLTVTSLYSNPEDDSFTITCVDSSNNQISIRRDKSASSDLVESLFSIGTTFDIVGPVGRYNGRTQINVVNISDVTFK